MKKSKIQIIDNNEAFIELFLLMPETEEFKILPFSSPVQALKSLEKEPVDLIISDIEMPEMSGTDFFDRVQDLYPDIPVILVTAYGSSEMAIQMIRKGAFHYFEKPINDKIDLFWVTVREALGKRRRLAQIESLQKEVSLSAMPTSMIGGSEGMQKVLESIREVADLPVTVLINGETGTGKELVARAVHDLGQRCDRPFFAVNCNEFSSGVLESELFGHERGAFTGAVTQKKGLFEIADKATLFLDEISSAPPAFQSKLLRVLETHDFSRVGGTARIYSDFRVITATNTDLDAEVEAGRFRADLLYRLNVYAIEIPPLRKRKEDIPLLADYYLNRFRKAYNRPLEGISERAIISLGLYDWPGNVRELVNVMERAVITCKGSMITTRDLPFNTEQLDALSNFNLKEMEKFFIGLALRQTGFNKTRAADLLGISRKTLIDKVKKYRIDDPNE
ncbi:MAG: sigma-54-dependent Fis family transcriptional regulator [Deltaproteobacteria bacterium]|nr:sigma-54-dependent Fis family transcriptional regulator [Deltaproteobacteria bacterium]